MRGRAWHAALQWELSVRSWDESATQRRKRRGEKTHTHLDRTKAYKCVRIRPRGIAAFVCLKNKGLLNCGGFVQPCLTSRFLQLHYKQTDYMCGNSAENEGVLAFIGIPGHIRKALCTKKNPSAFPCCVGLLYLLLYYVFDFNFDRSSHIPSTPSFPVSHFSSNLIK